MMLPFLRAFFRVSSNCAFTSAALALLVTSTPAQSAPARVQNADLAIILPAQRNLRIAARDVVSPLQDSLFPRELLTQIESAFHNTPVGRALETENTFEDWSLVSVRVVPCSPLGVIPSLDAQVFCWPEIRLVWQPVLKDFRRYAVVLNAFADDRAIHALYDFDASLVLNPEETIRASVLLNRIRTALQVAPTKPMNVISSEELQEFVKLRDKTSDGLVLKAQQLRSGSFTAAAYNTFDERPEFNNPTSASEFVEKLKLFLATSISAGALKEMTSFSLPEGREPPQIDDWVFIQFLRQGQKMMQQRITLRSAEDGRVLFDFGLAPRASQMRDEPQLHTALDSMNSRDAKEIRQRVLLSPMETATKSKIIADRNITLVPNTSCASCHKLNNLRFDFHALSYLEDRTISVSPRVKTDVMRDLEWLTKRGER
ncbi:MAG: hypothetical protein ACO3A4_07180 [Silvanigrellaceae bacterium]